MIKISDSCSMLRMMLFKRSVRDYWWIFLISVHSVAPTICRVHYSSLALVWIQHGVYSAFSLPCLIDWLLSHWLEWALVPTHQNKCRVSERKRKTETDPWFQKKNKNKKFNQGLNAEVCALLKSSLFSMYFISSTERLNFFGSGLISSAYENWKCNELTSVFTQSTVSVYYL